MILTIPVYIREERGAKTLYRVSGVFIDGVDARHGDADRALRVVEGALRRQATRAAAAGDHTALAAMCGDAAVAERRVRVAIDLRHHHVAAEVMIALLPAPGGWAARFLDLPYPWFHVADLDRLVASTETVLRAHLQRALAQTDELPALTAPRRGWIHVVELRVGGDPVRLPAVEGGPRRAGLGDERSDGGWELERTATRLDEDDGEPAWGRVALVGELAALLDDPARRPLLLVGASGSGKTTVLRAAARARQGRGAVWQVAPGRLISGMSVVGQWEARVEAILAHAAEHDLVLHIDDLVGLFRAGRSAQNDLTVGAVMKSWIEEGRLRLVIETTWEAVHVVQEIDRGFIDACRVVPVPVLGEDAASAAIGRLAAALEAGGDVRFAPAALRAVLELSRRYRGDRAMPGAAADLLRALAASGGVEDRAGVLRRFAATSGIAPELSDVDLAIDRDALVAALGRGVLGQEAAVAAMADAVIVAKAGLNDPGRPLASLLFTGPTGSGKTQCARALATVLFGSPERLLRFDLGEYAGADAVERLAGSLARPDGALTAAIRRQPFAVVLLDELEKADPAVFDLLLQVLGEARLSDAVGRTASFANAVIVLTSNLGVREAEGAALGFGAGRQRADDAYHAAIAGFFRPEFTARLDRIIPFAPLTARSLAILAERALAEVGERSGLSRRRLRLTADATALAGIAERAVSAGTGGRAVRAAVDGLVVRPLAGLLAAGGRGPGTVRVSGAGDRIDLALMSWQPCSTVAAVIPSGDDAALIARCDALAKALRDSEPKGPIGLDQVSGDLAELYQRKDAIELLRRRLRGRARGGGPLPIAIGADCAVAVGWQRWCAGDSADEAFAASGAALEIDALAVEVALLAARGTGCGDVALRLHGREDLRTSSEDRLRALAGNLGVAISHHLGQGWRLHGGAANLVARILEGTVLAIDREGAVHELCGEAQPLASADAPWPERWPERGERPVTALIDHVRGSWIDLRLGRRWALELGDQEQHAWAALRALAEQP